MTNEMQEQDVHEMFKYKKIANPSDCIFRISPSTISKFFEYPKVFYEEEVLQKEKTFRGNTATVLGSICHYIYESVTIGRPIDREMINTELDKFNSLNPELELDINDIKVNYPLIANEVVNNYVIPNNTLFGTNIKTEESIIMKVDDGIYLGGTYDRRHGSKLIDFKTVSTKPNEFEIPFNYKIQLLAYAKILNSKGIWIDTIELVYGVKPTKTLPARMFVVTENIDYIAEKLINDTIRLISETIIIARNRPDLVYLLFKSYDLKQG